MYNKELKMQYIEDNKDRNLTLEKNMIRFFNSIEKYEGYLNKDLSCFTMEEILDYYKSLGITSLESLMVMNSQFKLYTSYCQGKGIVNDGQNHYMELTTDLFMSCVNTALVNKKIITREQLISLAREQENPGDRFLLYALFEGIGGKRLIEISSFEKENIQKNKKAAKLCTGIIVSVTDEFIESVEEACEEYIYYTRNKDFDIIERKFKPYDSRPFKSLANAVKDDDRYQQIYGRIQRIKKENNDSPAITIAGLQESGRIQMIKDYGVDYNVVTDDGVKINIDIKYRNCILQNKKEIENKYGQIMSVTRYVEKYSEYLRSR